MLWYIITKEYVKLYWFEKFCNDTHERAKTSTEDKAVLWIEAAWAPHHNKNSVAQLRLYILYVGITYWNPICF